MSSCLCFLLLQIDSRKRPGELVSQISYAGIVDVKATWSGYCRLTLRNGEKLNFVGVPKADRKKLAELLADLVRRGAPAPDENGNVVVAGPTYWAIAVVMLVVIHSIDAAMTHNFALKGHYPISQK